MEFRGVAQHSGNQQCAPLGEAVTVINFPFSENFSALVCPYERRRGLPPLSSHCSRGDMKSTYQILIESDFMSKDLGGL